MGIPQLVAVNGSELSGYAIDLGDGLRLRLALDDWERLGLFRGKRVPVRLPGRDDCWLYVVEAVAHPPLVWVTLAVRVRSAG